MLYSLRVGADCSYPNTANLPIDAIRRPSSHSLDYPERFRVEHVNDMRTAIDHAAPWLQTREEQRAELRRLENVRHRRHQVQASELCLQT